MDNFSFFFTQGLSHISDLGAYDHILFIVALAALSSLKNWKTLFFSVTAFTIGHSIALALATFRLVKLNTEVVEFLIPVSIIITCCWNIVQVFQAKKNSSALSGLSSNMLDTTDQNKMFYVEHTLLHHSIIILFGLIHGLGFSNFLRFILSEDEGIFTPLLAFNIGLEVGQILILAIALIINFVFLRLIKIPYKYWATFVSLLVILISIPILLETMLSLFTDS